MSKYRNKLTEVDGIQFHSKKEARRWGELKLLQKAKKISGLERQVKFSLDINGEHICNYFADFVYSSTESHFLVPFPAPYQVVEDVKGVRTPLYRVKAKLMKAIHGIEIREV